MSICPVNGEPCCDDMCHGAGCVLSIGHSEPPLEECPDCGALVPIDEPWCEACDGEPDDRLEG